MTNLPSPIKYKPKEHFHEAITRPLDGKNDLNFIVKVVNDLSKENLKYYTTVDPKGRIRVHREGLPRKEHNPVYHNYFALKSNKNGTILISGKNARTSSSILRILSLHIGRANLNAQKILKKADVSAGKKCEMLGYTLLKQEEPFE